MKNDYKATKEWDEDLLELIEEEPSLDKIRYWAVRIQIVYSEKPKTSKGKPVIAIGNNTFNGKSAMTRVVIPSTVTTLCRAKCTPPSGTGALPF